jgi:alpha-beta hydrolase superfamily lysophospholipase
MAAARQAVGTAQEAAVESVSWLQRTLIGAGAMAIGAAMLTIGGTATLAHIITRPRRLRTVPARDVDQSVEEVCFATTDGLRLCGWRLTPAVPRAALVVAHGFAMHRSELLDLAHALVARDFAVLLFDFRAHGASDGVRSTVGYREANDIIAANDYLRHCPDLAGLPIGVAGISMGAAAAILAAARDERIAAVVADSSFATLTDIACAGIRAVYHLPAFPFGLLSIRFCELLTHARIHENRPVDVIAALAPRPLLIVHGADDQFVPVAHARRLYAAARAPKELWLVPGDGHAATFALHLDEYAMRLDRFFTSALASTPSDQVSIDAASILASDAA